MLCALQGYRDVGLIPGPHPQMVHQTICAHLKRRCGGTLLTSGLLRSVSACLWLQNLEVGESVEDWATELEGPILVWEQW